MIYKVLEQSKNIWMQTQEEGKLRQSKSDWSGIDLKSTSSQL